MSQVIHHEPDGDQIYSERKTIVASNLATIDTRLNSAVQLDKAYYEKFDAIIQAACVIKELLDDTIDVVLKAQGHFTAINQLDFWGSQLIRLRFQIENYVTDETKRKHLTDKIMRQYLFANSFKVNNGNVQKTFNDALDSLQTEADDELTLLTRLAMYHAFINKSDIRELVSIKDAVHTRFAEAQKSPNKYAQKSAYLMMANYYERIAEGNATPQSFRYAHEAVLQIWFVHKDPLGLSSLGTMVNYAIARGYHDYAETLLNTWARYRQSYVLDNLYNDAMYLGARGHLHYKRGNYESAKHCLTGAYQIYQRLGHEENIGRVLLFLGLTHNKLNAYEQGLTSYETARLLYDALKRDEFVIRAEHGLGWTYMNMGNHPRAIQWLEGALTKAEKSYSDTLVGTIYCLREDLALARSSL